MENIESLQLQLQQLEYKINQYKKMIADIPLDKVIARRSGTGYRYSRKIILPDGSNREFYIGKNNLSAFTNLVDRDYIKCLIVDYQEQSRYIQEKIRHLRYKSKARSFEEKHPGLQLLISDSLKESAHKMSTALRAWGAEPYSRNLNYPDQINKPTIIPGLMVRSKAEADIVAALTKYGIPFHYDELVSFADGNCLAIDFTCKNVSSGKNFIGITVE